MSRCSKTSRNALIIHFKKTYSYLRHFRSGLQQCLNFSVNQRRNFRLYWTHISRTIVLYPTIHFLHLFWQDKAQSPYYETRLSSGVVLNLDSIYIGLCSCSLFFKYKSRQITIIYAYYITQFHKFSTSLLCFDVEKKIEAYLHHVASA